ncbi:phosphatase PAP2 family protein [Thauera linaloolentis]|uniref:Phosphatidylglycerophosphatase B-like protein n=1 Tax=Thauera linaloolentis (strain DSM 12138 / JCM 21573 / CCUG 41526 / CIP 105981 / IAM 15112 / NBRC 102519 / 47Lol) TaxID=1123367 RepID=N6YZC0_THAL4|nr:phosphatase PAP2 family protein [Thauera linaloolentis]ENO85274.1 phosphatidylglycerophosphatase B -like protein [Thauera linaloolentis 47Lol = DSM 12138]MCM8564959.1 phosphatase PAP2 family protein [Thauera linaloolentis]
MKFLRAWLEPRILAAILILASAAWIFIEVADEVADGDAVTLDHALMLALHPQADAAAHGGPMWLQAAARDITALGSTTVLSLLVCVVAGFLLLLGRRRTALFVLASSISGALLTLLLKDAFARPRPDLLPHGDFVTTASFPSGHAMLSAIVYLTLGSLLARLAGARREKGYIMGAAVFFSAIVGLSRVYLGVHWPTDVLAGWAAGAAWAMGWWMAAELAGARRR